MNLPIPSKNILVAPLNWGLGHATRCIPIIKALEENGFLKSVKVGKEKLYLNEQLLKILEGKED